MSLLEEKIHRLTELYVYALNRHDLKAAIQLCAPDAIVLSSSAPPAKGEKAIGTLLKSWMDCGFSGARIANPQIQYSENLAAENGEYTARFEQKTRSKIETGTYIIAYQRQPNGEFKITALVLSGEPSEFSVGP
jgi:ketosteroid isomerase-like protein